MKHVTVSEYTSMSSSDAARNMPQSTWSKQSCSIESDWSDQHWIVPRGGCFTFQFLPISRQKQNGRVIRFAERWAGEGLVCVPEGGVAVVQYTISTRVDGDVLKVFWSYCSEVGFIKVPRNNKPRIWVRGFLLPYIPVQFPECLVCVGLRGNITAVIMIAVNSLGSQNGQHRSIWNSRSGEQKDLIECMFLSSHHELLI